MDLSFSEEQQRLKDAAREFLAAECPNELVRRLEDDPSGHSPELWRKIGGQGWTALPVPASYGGRGAGFLDVCAVQEELGRALAPGPFADVVLAEYLLQRLAPDDIKQRLLPLLADGSAVATVAYTESSGSYEADSISTIARAEGDRWLLHGTKLFVGYAHVADYLLVAARTADQGLGVFLVEASTPGLKVERLRSMDAGGQCEVVLDNVVVPSANLLGSGAAAAEALAGYLDRGAVLTCVAAVGGAGRALELATDYVKERVQFGRPIGTFQAVSHRCADMAIDLDGMRFVVYHAAWKLDQAEPADFEVGVAKACAAEAYQRITESGHRVMGGIGFTKASDMQMYYRHSKATAQLFGNADQYTERIAREIGL